MLVEIPKPISLFELVALGESGGSHLHFSETRNYLRMQVVANGSKGQQINCCVIRSYEQRRKQRSDATNDPESAAPNETTAPATKPLLPETAFRDRQTNTTYAAVFTFTATPALAQSPTR